MTRAAVARPTGRGWSARGTGAAVAAGAGAALLAHVAATTPWRPVPGERRALPKIVPALEAADGDFTDEERERGAALRRDLLPTTLAGPLVGLAATGVLGFTGAGARLVHRVRALLPAGTPVPLVAAAGGLATAAVAALPDLPLAYRTYRVLRRHGLSTQTPVAWAGDQAKAAAIGVTFGGSAAALTAVATARYPAAWPAHLAVGAGVATVGLSTLAPLVLEPLFLHFTPVPEGTVRETVDQVARRSGVPVQDVLTADASRRTTAPNAYVSGLGRTRRVVLFDTLLGTTPTPEVGLVVAHELGHVRHHDVRTGTVNSALGAATLCGLLGVALTSRRLLAAAGARDAADPASLPLVLALSAVAGAIVQPLAAAVSRRVEARADVFSLAVTGDPATMAAVGRRLAVASRAHPRPNPLLFLLRATHPAAVQRIAIARGWAARHGLPVPGPLAPSAGTEPGAPQPA